MNFSPRGQTQSLRTGKVAVIGAIARKGMVVAKVIENTDTRTLDSFVRSTVADDVSLVATDEHSGYRLLGKDYNHQSVTHGSGQYVAGIFIPRTSILSGRS